ncbi:hypothetical protein KSP40_PGU019934 [Platanthera guangdongensis]|uniref:Transposase n=1 Tax=Platanthera guangdongensis TaxID=2320717 RepID=A0ABR2MC21_9ASPA
MTTPRLHRLSSQLTFSALHCSRLRAQLSKPDAGFRLLIWTFPSEFSQAAQRRCGACGGSGLVVKGESYSRCPTCGLAAGAHRASAMGVRCVSAHGCGLVQLYALLSIPAADPLSPFIDREWEFSPSRPCYGSGVALSPLPRLRSVPSMIVVDLSSSLIDSSWSFSRRVTARVFR